MRQAHRLALLTIFVVLMGSRAPDLLLHPRFWAEEGSMFYQYAHEHSWHDTLLKPFTGCYNFLQNAVAVLCQLLPIRYAPWATTYFGLLVQSIPFVIIIWGRSPLWDSAAKKTVSCMLVLFSPAYSGEIWLTMTDVHFHLCLIAFLILIEPADGVRKATNLLRLLILAVAGLTRTVSTFLLPVFLLAAWQEKSRERYHQAVVLSFCLVVQVAAFGASLQNRGYGQRGFDSVQSFARTLASTAVAVPFIGWAGWEDRNTMPYGAILAASLCACAALYMLLLRPYLRENRGTERAPLPLKAFGSYLLVMVPSVALSLLGEGGLRYAYAPAVMLSFFFLSLALYGGRYRALPALVMVFILASGVCQYWSGMYLFDQATWPRWDAEVGKWEKDPSYHLKIWPQQMNTSKGPVWTSWEVRVTRQQAST